MYGTVSLWFTYRSTVPVSQNLPTYGSHTDERYQFAGSANLWFTYRCTVPTSHTGVHIQMYGTNQHGPAHLCFTYRCTVPASGDLPTCGSHTDVRYRQVKICQLGSHTYVRYQLTMNMKRVCQLVVHIPKYGTNLHLQLSVEVSQV